MYFTASRVIRVAALVVTTTAFGGAAAPALANTTYPTPGGSTFTNGSNDGWMDAGGSCALLGVVPAPVCSVSNEIAATQGNPPGSLRTRFTSAASALTLVSGTGTARSSSFTVKGYPTISGATLNYDRSVKSNGLIAAGLGVTSTVKLVDETTSAITVLKTETFAADTPFAPAGPIAVPGSVFVPGRGYHLDITTQVASLLVVAFGTVDTNYDNINLSVADNSVAPTATTLPATNVNASGATLNGSLTTGGPPVTTYYEYGPSTAYGATTPARVVSTDGPAPS